MGQIWAIEFIFIFIFVMLNKLYLQLYFSLHLKWGPTLFLHKCFLSLSSILLSSRLFSLKPNLIAKSSLLLLFINAIDNENVENNDKNKLGTGYDRPRI